MRVISVLLTFGLMSVLWAQAPAGKPGSIAGTITDSVSHQGIRRATVSIVSPPHLSRLVLADEAGKFQFPNLEPGPYQVEYVRAPGYLYQPHTRLVFVVTEDHTANVQVDLTPLGVVSGKAVDSSGDPFVGAHVTIVGYTYSKGTRTLEAVDGATTDDRGEYRIFDLPPNRYFVMATNPRSYSLLGGRVHADAVEMAYVTTWFPNVTDGSQATPQVLAAGAELDGIDLHMHKQRVFHVRGKAQLPPGQRGAVSVESCGDGPGIGVNAAILRDGTFDAGGLVAGNWCLIVNQVVDNSHAFYANQRVTIADHDMNNVNLTLTPAAVVRGQILLDGAAPAKLQHIPIRLDPIEQPGRGAGSAAKEDGSFVVENVSPGQYRLMNVGLSSMYLKTIRVNGQDAANGIVQVPEGGAQLTLLFSTDSGEVSGTVEGGGAFVSAEGVNSVTGLPVLGGVTPEGKFLIRNLAPGDYKILAWGIQDTGLLQYADFRKLFESRAVPVTIHLKDHESVQLTAVNAAEIEAALPRLR